MTYEEKWMLQQVFATIEKEPNTEASLQGDDPYTLTRQETGVARRLGARLTQAVRHTGTVPVSPLLGHRHQPTTMPLVAEGQRRELVFDKHRQGTVCQAKHVPALLKESWGLDVHARTIQRHVRRMGVCG